MCLLKLPGSLLGQEGYSFNFKSFFFFFLTAVTLANVLLHVALVRNMAAHVVPLYFECGLEFLSHHLLPPHPPKLSGVRSGFLDRTPGDSVAIWLH